MNAKQILSISAMALIAPVFAQTVPAEEWVGAPIRSAAAASRGEVVDAYFASRAEPAAPQELRVGPADAQPGALSSAEVAADLNLWIRSGMSQAVTRDDFDPNTPAYRAQIANYQRLRHGPAFVAEVQRLQGQSFEAITSARAGDETAAR